MILLFSPFSYLPLFPNPPSLYFSYLAGNTRVNDIWQEKTGPYLQILHTTFPVSGIITPAIFKPFLSSKILISNTNASNVKFNNSLPIYLFNSTKETLNETKQVFFVEKESRIYIPFSICAAYSFILLSFFAFAYTKRKIIKTPEKELVSYVQEKDKCLINKFPSKDDDSEVNNGKISKETDTEENEIVNVEKDNIKVKIFNGKNSIKQIKNDKDDTEEEKVLKITSSIDLNKSKKNYFPEDEIKNLKRIKRKLRILSQLLFYIVAFLQAGREYLINTLTMPYNIECSGWKKSEGANIIMAIYFFYVLLRSINIYLFKKFKIIWLVLGNCLLALVSSIFFVSTNHNENKTLMLISVAINALAVSTTFTVTLIWSRSFFEVTPKFVASFLLCFYIGMSTWPVLATYLFTEIHCFWYPLINLILGLLWTLIIFILLFVQLKRKLFKRKHSYIF